MNWSEVLQQGFLWDSFGFSTVEDIRIDVLLCPEERFVEGLKHLLTKGSAEAPEVVIWMLRLRLPKDLESFRRFPWAAGVLSFLPLPPPAPVAPAA